MNEKNPRIATDMVDMIAPGKSVEWLSGYARQFPDQPAAANGAHLFQMLKAHSGDPAVVLKRAGFDAIDTGAGDVRKLTGQGIRSKDAVFDPARAQDGNIFLGIGGAAAAPGILSDEFWAAVRRGDAT
jgi:hypothetical protein